MTVYVVHPVDHDIGSAKDFGQISYINQRYVYGDELVDDSIPPSFLKAIRHAVGEFDFETDYLLLAGDHLQLIQVSAELAALHINFQVLRYDRKVKRYLPVWIMPHATACGPSRDMVGSG